MVADIVTERKEGRPKLMLDPGVTRVWGTGN